jgi:hypothetical protein
LRLLGEYLNSYIVAQTVLGYKPSGAYALS